MSEADLAGAPGPLYQRVKRYITERIVSGELGPGARVPSEKDLVERLAVSRMTVNRALRELTQEGAVIRIQGVGSFVSERKPKASILEVHEIGDTIAAAGGTHVRRLVEKRAERAAGRIAALMETPPGAPILYAAIAHFNGDAPMQLERRFARADFAPDFLSMDFERDSAFAHFQQIAPETDHEHVVEADRPDPLERSALGLGPDHPVLRIRRRTWIGDRIVTLSSFTHPHETYRVVARVPAYLRSADPRP
jgi:GntR family histidine utilization transcriptional repressor